MNKLKKYAGLLNDEAPKDHFLAYITGNERDMLVQAGGSGHITKSGIPSFESGWDMSVDYGSSDSSSGSEGDDYGGGNNNQQTNNQSDNNYVPDYESPMTTEQEKIVTGNVDAGSMGAGSDEYLEPDKDHWKATQKAIKEGQKPYINEKGEKVDPYKADWNDWTKEQQESYQKEMNELKGTTDKNYSFYKGNEGTTNLSFSEHWKDVPATNPIAAASPLLRLLIAGGRTLKENFTTDYGTWKYGAKEGTGSGTPFDSGGWFGKIFNKDGSVKTNLTDDQINDAYNQATPDLAPIIGGTTPQPSMVDKYFANLNNTNLGINQNYLNTYNTAKANIANTLNMTPNTQQYGYGNTFNDNYARSMTSANPFFDELTSEGLI